MSAKEFICRINVQSILSFVVVLFGFAYIWFADNQDSKDAVENFIIMVLAFYYGSSKGSAKKDEIIQQQQEGK